MRFREVLTLRLTSGGLFSPLLPLPRSRHPEKQGPDEGPYPRIDGQRLYWAAIPKASGANSLRSLLYTA